MVDGKFCPKCNLIFVEQGSIFMIWAQTSTVKKYINVSFIFPHLKTEFNVKKIKSHKVELVSGQQLGVPQAGHPLGLRVRLFRAAAALDQIDQMNF